MINVLIFGLTENPGGIESFIMSYYRNIDKNDIHFDFLCNTHNDVAFEDELEVNGSIVYHIEMRSKNRKKYKKELKCFFEKYAEKYNAIWINVCSLANIDYLIYAKKYNIPCRIIHSHNSMNMDSKLRGILHTINKQIVGKYATNFWACSHDAAKWFYKKSLIEKSKIIPNAIDINAMRFSDEKRRMVREQYDWDNQTKVIGNIGRLHFQKTNYFY